MVSENLKEKILENFSLPFLYSLEDWKELNNSDFYWINKIYNILNYEVLYD